MCECMAVEKADDIVDEHDAVDGGNTMVLDNQQQMPGGRVTKGFVS